MRDSKGNKVGALSVPACVERATELIKSEGACLFLIDMVHSTKMISPEREARYLDFLNLRHEASVRFAEHMPMNKLATGSREEQGFSEALGDASWAGIDDPSVINDFVAFKDELFPLLSLHYSVAKDGWDDAIRLVR